MDQLDISTINQLISTGGLIFIAIFISLFYSRIYKKKVKFRKEIVYLKDIIYLKKVIDKYKAENLANNVNQNYITYRSEVAEELGYKAMQFNLVLVSNKRAVRLWTNLGFNTVGKIPKAFDHPKIGYVDALIMHKWL